MKIHLVSDLHVHLTKALRSCCKLRTMQHIFITTVVFYYKQNAF